MLLKNWESAFTLVRLVPTQKFTFSQITEVFFESRHDYIVIQSRLILTNLTPVPPGGWRPIEKGCGPHHNSLPAQSTLADRCQGARHWQARCLRGARRSRSGRMPSHGSGFKVFDIYLGQDKSWDIMKQYSRLPSTTLRSWQSLPMVSASFPPWYFYSHCIHKAKAPFLPFPGVPEEAIEGGLPWRDDPLGGRQDWVREHTGGNLLLVPISSIYIFLSLI